LYFRLLRVRYLRPGSLTAFLLFEGSIVLGALLALADIVNWWGVLAVPVAVAAMVKVHDGVAALVGRPMVVSAGPRGRGASSGGCTDARASSGPGGGGWPARGGDVAVGAASVPHRGPTLAARLRPRPRPGGERAEPAVPAPARDEPEPKRRPKPN